CHLPVSNPHSLTLPLKSDCFFELTQLLRIYQTQLNSPQELELALVLEPPPLLPLVLLVQAVLGAVRSCHPTYSPPSLSSLQTATELPKHSLLGMPNPPSVLTTRLNQSGKYHWID